MAARRPFALILATIVASMGASYRTSNFIVEAQTPEIARQIGQRAEYFRQQKAQQWIGQEMPPWGRPCPLRVTITMSGAGGATEFVYDQGQILNQDMHIEGPLERLLNSVLPHEVTHTVFAYYYRRPVPRWADEGGSVLSEDDIERNHHDMLVRQILNTPGRAIPLGRLFSLENYPRDVMCLYAQGYSVSNFLVEKSGRANFLAFVDDGMRHGWDGAVRSYYRYRNVNELEQAWLESLRAPRRPALQFASNNGPADAGSASRLTVRLSVPMPQQGSDSPGATYRGQMADSEPETRGPAGRPGYPGGMRPGQTPEFLPPPGPQNLPQDRWQPSPPPPGSVHLGPPQPLAPNSPTSIPVGGAIQR
jgi:hypothetical protein